MNRYQPSEIAKLVTEFQRDGFCILRDHFPKQKIEKWRTAFEPLLNAKIASDTATAQNRGAARFYVTLPFDKPFADPEVYEDADILVICEAIVGKDMVMCQLASDTPLKGSDYQEIHSDAAPLFPESNVIAPSFQLAVNFPLVDVTDENGPFEVARGTHLISKAEGLERLESGAAKLEAVKLNIGDVMIRDVRGLHRGTPNRTDEPRPMCVIGYSRKWLYRPEVDIKIPRHVADNLSERARQLLRFNPIVEPDAAAPREEIYQAFAY